MAVGVTTGEAVGVGVAGPPIGGVVVGTGVGVADLVGVGLGVRVGEAVGLACTRVKFTTHFGSG